jgi:glycosyltransferase involved in cell wall biosynthesis
MKVHFCIDARMVNNSGIGVYLRQYIQYILESAIYDVTLLGRGSELNTYFNAYEWRHVEANFPIYTIQEQVKLPLLIPDCDIFWSPHYNIPLMPIRARKHLATIPDLFHLAYYNTLGISQKIYAKVVANAAVRKPDLLTTISYFSKKEIVRLTGATDSKIKVIHLGINKRLFRRIDDQTVISRVREDYQLPEQYILFVGNVKPNKNLRSLVEAFSMLIERTPNLYLMIVGKKEGFITSDSGLFSYIDSNKSLSERIRFTGFVLTEDLPVIYSLATVFAFPSIYEGFGFPPLEAMACGCPVIASESSSIPEICGDAAYYVNPLNIESIAEGLHTVITNESLKNQLIQKGFEQCSHYSWVESSQQFINVVNELV